MEQLPPARKPPSVAILSKRAKPLTFSIGFGANGLLFMAFWKATAAPQMDEEWRSMLLTVAWMPLGFLGFFVKAAIEGWLLGDERE